MRTFDLIIIGGGSGLAIVEAARQRELKVALIEEYALGGTCLNRGCIPSKMLIHVADVVENIQQAHKFFLHTTLKKVDFGKLVTKVSATVDAESKEIEQAVRADEHITFFKERAEFIGKKKLRVGKETITAKKIVIFSGTREFIPPIEGLQTVPYLTSTEALRLTKQPKSMLIIGGGFIAAELGHFYGALGTKITIVQRDSVLLSAADKEIAEKFTESFGKKHTVLVNTNAVKVEKKGKKVSVVVESNGKRRSITADTLLLAVGRKSNSDILKVEKTGIITDKRGYIKTNNYLETNVQGIWAAGDIRGKWLFKHGASFEAQHLITNLFSKKKVRVPDIAMPSAVFTSPQIASIGKREQDLKEGTYNVGRHAYKKTGMGLALQDKEGFVKFLTDKKTNNILGCHILGQEASILIHEVIVAMHTGNKKINGITDAIHIHPALSEVVQRAAYRTHAH